MLVMASEPLPDYSPDDVREWYVLHKNEQGLADAYAAAHNEAWWVEDDEYDFEEGTPEYAEARRITDEWFSVMDELKEAIFVILQAEGIRIPKTGQIQVLAPFMERNGYYDGNGWWAPKSENVRLRRIRRAQ